MTPAGLDPRQSMINSAILPALGPLRLQDVTGNDVRALLAAHRC